MTNFLTGWWNSLTPGSPRDCVPSIVIFFLNETTSPGLFNFIVNNAFPEAQDLKINVNYNTMGLHKHRTIAPPGCYQDSGTPGWLPTCCTSSTLWTSKLQKTERPHSGSVHHIIHTEYISPDRSWRHHNDNSTFWLCQTCTVQSKSRDPQPSMK